MDQQPGSFERIWFFTFGVQRLNGAADAVGKWMATGVVTPGSARGVDFAQCERAARAWFGARPGRAGGDAFCAALASARALTMTHAAFLRQHARGDLDSLLVQTAAALQRFADVLDQLDVFPAAASEAAALRAEAARCDGLSRYQSSC